MRIERASDGSSLTLVLELTPCECARYLDEERDTTNGAATARAYTFGRCPGPGYVMSFRPCKYENVAIAKIPGATHVKTRSLYTGRETMTLACPLCSATRKGEHHWIDAGWVRCDRCGAPASTPGTRMESLYDHLPLAPLLEHIEPTFHTTSPTHKRSWIEENLGLGNIYTSVDYGVAYKNPELARVRMLAELATMKVQYTQLVRPTANGPQLCTALDVYITPTGVSVRPDWP